MEGYILQEYGSAIVNENVREMSLLSDNEPLVPPRW